MSSSVPVQVLGIADATSVSAGGKHTCAIHTNGDVSCWGDASQLGNLTNQPATTPQRVSSLPVSVSQSSGYEHSCAVAADGSTRCWGCNYLGQLGNGTTNSGCAANLPVVVTGTATAATIAAGANHTCAVLSDGSMSCWGYNLLGNLGNGTGGYASVPVAVVGY